MEAVHLRSHDVCVALELTISPKFTFRELAGRVGLSVGESHNSVGRLEKARLYLPHRGTVNRQALLEFLVSGVPYAFPGVLGPETRGVPTAHSGPALRDLFLSQDAIVWPSAEGTERGLALLPLCPQAARLPDVNPKLYRFLSTVDALRIGRARERNVAREMLAGELLGDS